MSTPWIRILALSSLAAFWFLCPNPNVRPAAAAPPAGYALDWSDEFSSGTTVDPNRWNVDTFWKNPTQFATNAVKVLGGQLILTTYTQGGTQYSGSVNTMNKYEPLYGYVEASIEFDNSQGMFSTFWLWSHLMATPGHPHENGTEIDIAEHSLVIGNPTIGYTDTHSQASTTLHWDGYSPGRTGGGDLHSGVGDLGSGFHTYGHEWTPDVERFYYDGILVWTANDSPGDPSPPLTPVSHTNEFIVLSSEVGLPPCWCGPIPNTPPGSGYGTLGPPDPSETKVFVDYVRHYRDATPPANVVDLCPGSPGTTTMLVTWAAPGDNAGRADAYDLRYATYPITNMNFSGATPVNPAPPRPLSAGSAESYQVTGLTPCRTYYFAIKTRDAASNWSGLSNVPSATTRCSSISAAGRTEEAATICNPGAAKLPVTVDEGSLSFSAPSPNPASGGTSFHISVPAEFQGAKLRVDVFDIAGRRVRSLVDGIASQGPATVEWNLMNDSGRRVASGLYRVRVYVGETQKTLPLLVLR